MSVDLSQVKVDVSPALAAFKAQIADDLAKLDALTRSLGDLTKCGRDTEAALRKLRDAARNLEGRE